MEQGQAAIFSFLTIVSISFAIPQVISLDGYLTNSSGSALNGSYSFVFSIYNQTPGGSALWTEMQTIAVSSGKLNALLGSVNALNLPFDQDYYLGVKVGADSEMSPRYRVASSGYAYTANSMVPGANATGDLYISGRAGVGTSAPKAKLDVNGTIASTGATGGVMGKTVQIRYSAPSDRGEIYAIEDNSIYKPLAIDASNVLINTQSSGKVGIGTASPGAKLQVDVADVGADDGIVIRNSGVPNTQIALQHSVSGNGSYIFMFDDTGTVKAAIRTYGDSIFTGGRVGIGTASPSLAKLVIGTPGSTTPGVDMDLQLGGQGAFGFRSYNDGSFNYLALDRKYGDWQTNPAIRFRADGPVTIPGTLSKGAGSFLIDDPLDPQNKILQHSFVESPDMKNIYDGTISLNSSGEAALELPAYFEALNRDFRYQLTPIGASMPNLFIKQKISQNRFTISGGIAGGEVSWQVTGTRKDAFAQQNRIIVEQEKGVGNDYKKGECIHKEACE